MILCYFMELDRLGYQADLALYQQAYLRDMPYLV